MTTVIEPLRPELYCVLKIYSVCMAEIKRNLSYVEANTEIHNKPNYKILKQILNDDGNVVLTDRF